jgi:hypothetical protein
MAVCIRLLRAFLWEFVAAVVTVFAALNFYTSNVQQQDGDFARACVWFKTLQDNTHFQANTCVE